METGLLKHHGASHRAESEPDRSLSSPRQGRISTRETKRHSLRGEAAEPFGNADMLSPDQQRRLRALATQVEFQRSDELIYAQGSPAAFIYFVEDGLIRISRLTENGRRQILAFRSRGDLAGLPHGGHYANSAETVSAARVLRIPWLQLQGLMMTEPNLPYLLIEKLASQVRDAQKRILILGQQSIHQRLALFLLDCLEVPAFYDAAQAKLRIPVNRFDLADYLGTAPESTARAFARLEGEGLVKRIDARTIEIRDLAGLQGLRNERRRSQR
jgi:CRP-like cAMP-binding protein